MPIYEYECNICHFHFDKRQSFNEESLAACPNCQGKTHRVLQPTPVIFKGSGFYVTDSRKASTTMKASKGTKERK